MRYVLAQYSVCCPGSQNSEVKRRLAICRKPSALRVLGDQGAPAAGNEGAGQASSPSSPSERATRGLQPSAHGAPGRPVEGNMGSRVARSRHILAAWGKRIQGCSPPRGTTTLTSNRRHVAPLTCASSTTTTTRALESAWRQNAGTASRVVAADRCLTPGSSDGSVTCRLPAWHRAFPTPGQEAPGLRLPRSGVGCGRVVPSEQ